MFNFLPFSKHYHCKGGTNVSYRCLKLHLWPNTKLTTLVGCHKNLRTQFLKAGHLVI
jgi:hypothetical protein